MGKNRHELIDLVSDQAASRQVIHIALGFDFGKDALLGSASVVESEGVSCPCFLVGQDDLVFIVAIRRLEEVELNRTFLWRRHSLPENEDSERVFPLLRTPPFFEERPVPVDRSPSLAPLDLVLYLNAPW